MNKFVKWLMIVSICMIFAMDSIVLLSLKAGAAVVVSQETIANSSENMTGSSMGLGVQFTDQSTNSSPSMFSNSGNGGNTTILNPSNIMQVQDQR